MSALIANRLLTRALPWLLTAALAMVAVGAESCGGGSAGDADHGFTLRAGTTMVTTSMTRQQFTARANQACRKAWAAIVERFAEYTEKQSPRLSSRQRLTEAIRLSLLGEIDFHLYDSIQMLGAPRGEKRAAEGIIGPLQIAVERGQRQVQLHSLAEVADFFGTYNLQAHRYGLDDCLVDETHLRRLEA